MVLVDGTYCEDLEIDCLESRPASEASRRVCLAVKEPTRCVGATRPMRYCIDRYEFPNRAGVRPMVMQNFYQAQLHCAARGKRICTESEWTKACEGPDNKPFPYGYVRDPTACRGDVRWDNPQTTKLLERDPAELERLWKGVESGSQPRCVSDYGVHDMPGNADELAAAELHVHGKFEVRGRSFGADFDNVTTGGPWYFGARNMCRPKIRTHDESFAYYYLSWRCCAEADGAPTDPRTPKQRERNLAWEKVVHTAHHSWKMPWNPVVPGDERGSPASPSLLPPKKP
ncbi:MAG: SUMF1/EgtB/PvdO family nonheme iron enzyme [Deltaproteobacteria bacterium]|nr:SUMF1/EgtB/PvdO family nonheme iron enzyme [Deltaproteobacteria bacterium]